MRRLSSSVNSSVYNSVSTKYYVYNSINVLLLLLYEWKGYYFIRFNFKIILNALTYDKIYFKDLHYLELFSVHNSSKYNKI